MCTVQPAVTLDTLVCGPPGQTPEGSAPAAQFDDQSVLATCTRWRQPSISPRSRDTCALAGPAGTFHVRSLSPDVPCDLRRRGMTWIDEARSEVDDLPVNSVEEDRLVSQVQARLTDKYPEVSSESIAAAIGEARAQFDGRRVRDFVPLLVERVANTKLASLVAS